MTKPIAVLTQFFVLSICCSFANAQDYTLSHLHSNSMPHQSTSDTISVGKLPSDIFEPDADEAKPVVISHAGYEQNKLVNYSILAGFAALLFLGGAITIACVHAKRKLKTTQPMSMVSVNA